MEAAFGWKPALEKTSAGQDFLGLMAPIENILDAVTSGLTNATVRARYFTLVPWYFWRYTQLAGETNRQEQKAFAAGFEMLIAYANVAAIELEDGAGTGIIRRDLATEEWRTGNYVLPLRGNRIPETPSPNDAVLYGPSLRRLNLLGKTEKFETCQKGGSLIAGRLDAILRKMPSCEQLMTATTVTRDEVESWIPHLRLDRISNLEKQLLRDLFFSTRDFEHEETPPRVLTLQLLMDLANTASVTFNEEDVENALASGTDLSGFEFNADTRLAETHTQWRIIVLLKQFRHASELAFDAVHRHINHSGRHFDSAESACEDLLREMIHADLLPDSYKGLREQVKGTMTGVSWEPDGSTAVDVLQHAAAIVAWCHNILDDDRNAYLLAHTLATFGSSIEADIRTYFDQLTAIKSRKTNELLKWLCVDRAIARHFQVAARKLVQHDTYRIIEDAGRVSASDNCPIAGVAVRIGAMLSILADIGLLQRDDKMFQIAGQE